MNDVTYTTDLARGLRMIPYDGVLVHGEKNAHTFHIKLMQGSEAYLLATGATIVGSFIRLDDQTESGVAKTIVCDGGVEDGVPFVILPTTAYAVVTRFRLMVTATVKDDTTAILWLEGRVVAGGTDVVYDPETLVPDITDLLANINDMQNATYGAQQVARACKLATDDLQAKIDAGMFLTKAVRDNLLILFESASYLTADANDAFKALKKEWEGKEDA